MDSAALLLVGLVIAVGIVGSLLPVLPGLPVAWAAVVFWAVADGGGVVRWSVVAVTAVLMAGGFAAKFLLSSRSLRARGAPRKTLVAAAVGGVVGFFVIPVVGLFIGIVVGALLAEYARLGRLSTAWSSAMSVLLALGVGTLIEVTAGIGIGLIWLGAVLVV